MTIRSIKFSSPYRGEDQGGGLVALHREATEFGFAATAPHPTLPPAGGGLFGREYPL